jgi:hypothetical protein
LKLEIITANHNQKNSPKSQVRWDTLSHTLNSTFTQLPLNLKSILERDNEGTPPEKCEKSPTGVLTFEMIDLPKTAWTKPRKNEEKPSYSSKCLHNSTAIAKITKNKLLDMKVVS